MIKIFLCFLQYVFFVFSPLFFLIHIVFNLIGIASLPLFIMLAIPASLYLFYRNFHFLCDLNPSVFSKILLAFFSLLLFIVNFKAGIDNSSDTYYYHLNLIFPIYYYHNLLKPELYDLMSFTKGYPKFGEFLQSIAVFSTNNFWGYGLISALAVPASYSAAYMLSNRLGFEQKTSDLIGLVYALNPVNIAQATTGYVDTTQSLYVIMCLYLAFSSSNFLMSMIFLLNLAALINIKFTGTSQAFFIIIIFLFLHKKEFSTNKKAYASLFIFGLSLASAHYIYNYFVFHAPLYPYQGLNFANYIANKTVDGVGLHIIERLRLLFWSLPSEGFPGIAKYDCTKGAFGPLWFIMPFFIIPMIYKAVREKAFDLISVQLVLLLFLLLDPIKFYGRYIVYFQFVGFSSFYYILKTKKPFALMLPVLYAALACYIIFNQDSGIIKNRLEKYGSDSVLLESLESTTKKNFVYYYDEDSICSGYYWLLKFNGIAPTIVKDRDFDRNGNYFYIHSQRDESGLVPCAVEKGHGPADIDISVAETRYPNKVEISYKIKNPSVMKSCKLCLSDYGCLYIPQSTLHSPLPVPFKRPGEKHFSVECETMDNQFVRKNIDFMIGSDFP